MTTTDARARATFLLEVALDQERLKTRIAALLRAHRVSLRPPEGLPQLDYRDRFVINGKPVSYRQYQRWEAAQSMPEWKWMEVIADVLGVTQADLLADEEPAAPADAPAEEPAGLAQIDARLARIEAALGIPRERPDEPPPGQAADA